MPNRLPIITSPSVNATGHCVEGALTPCVEALDAVLWRLGHRCRGICPKAICAVESPTWIRTRGRLTASVALVILDLTEHPQHVVSLAAALYDVNRCVRPDHIRVVASRWGHY